ncbi:hypothetical protein [Sphingomonas sp. UYP23]
MSTNHPLDQFHRLHADVLTLLDRAKPYLSGREAGACVVLTPFRDELTAALHALDAYTQRALFGPILTAGGPDVATVCTLKAEYIKLGFDYQVYQRKWAGVDINAHWAEYRLAGLAMMRHMRERIGALDVAISALCERHFDAVRDPVTVD